MEPATFEDAEAALSSLPRFAVKGAEAYRPGLERITELLRGLGDPHTAFASIHVGGTNGKGSTASMLASIAAAAGLRTGLHTSPHLFHVSERMRIDGRPAPREWLAGAVRSASDLIDRVGPSYFEATMAFSLLFFAEHGVELGVVEVGLGGRLDATNILTPRLSVITSVGLDHTEILGDTIEAVAREKAGIIKAGIPVVTGAQATASDVIRREAERRGAPFHAAADEVEVLAADSGLASSTLHLRTPLRAYENLIVGLAGTHQIRNALAALRGAELAVSAVREDPTAVYDGMRDVLRLSGLRGRMEVLRERPLLVADVAHNSEGLAAVLGHLRAHREPLGRLTVLMGAMRDKDVGAMGRLLAEAGAIVRPVAIESDRAWSPAELAAALEVVQVDVDKPSTVGEGVQAFLSTASDTDTLLVTGSHLVAAEAVRAAQ